MKSGLIATMVLCVCAVLASGVQADDVIPPPESVESETSAAPEQIARLIEELGDARFSVRRDATEALIAAGLPAIEPVTQAALSGSPEVTVRCLQILRRLKEGGDVEVRQAAIASLRQLARSENELVAQRAEAALDESPLQNTPVVGGVPIQIQVQGGFAAGNVTVRTSVVNGRRTVSVQENDRRIEIRDQDGKEIAITVSEPVNGQMESRDYSADDLDQLRQNHPDIAELYEKYSTQGNGIQLQVFGGLMPANPPPQRRPRNIPVPAIPVIPGFNPPGQAAADEMTPILERLESVSAMLREWKEAQDADKDALEELLQELESIREELAEAKARLDQ